MATPTEIVKAITAELSTVTESLRTARMEVAELRAANGRLEDRLLQAVAQAALHDKEVAVLRQRLDDHLKRVELWDTRRWGLVVAVALAVLGSALSFASGLLLVTLRTTPK